MKIVWHCEDRAGAAMAGPAIRAVELCRRLAAHHHVTLACPGAGELAGEPFAVHDHAPARSLRPLLDGADALVTQGFGFPFRDLFGLPKSLRLLLDLYDPVQLELLARYGARPSADERLHLAMVRRRLLLLLGRADHVLCASQRQRAFWLGWLGASGRLTPESLVDDPAATSLLAIVPFGISTDEAASRQPPAASPRILWWGGLWDWMDPLTPIRALDVLRRRGIDATLVLPAANRPGAEPMQAALDAEREARARGLWGSGVEQLAEWVPMRERAAVLASASVAVSCHRPGLEAELAFRTRLLDCVWAGLPVVATAGDDLSARAAAEGWALTVPPGDSDALASALARLLDPAGNAAAREAAARARAAYAWDVAPIEALLGRPAPRRSRGLFPELSGGDPGRLARALASKLLHRLTP